MRRSPKCIGKRGQVPVVNDRNRERSAMPNIGIATAIDQHGLMSVPASQTRPFKWATDPEVENRASVRELI
jgi:hypothetical protein